MFDSNYSRFKLLGTLSDGDLRKSRNHKSLSAKISNIYNKNQKNFMKIMLIKNL